MKLDTYDDWKHCITVSCGIPLTLDYIDERISDLRNPRNDHTRRFTKTWGEAHLQTVIGWFERARKEMAP